jgi:mycothiol synthase
MDQSRLELRGFRDTDFEGVAAVLNAEFSDNRISPEYLRHIYESFSKSAQGFDLVVVDHTSQQIVGAGSLFRIVIMDDPEFQWISCDVLPERRRQGVGSRLFDGLLAEARRRGLRGLRVTVREDSPEGLTFVAHRGFVERRRVWRSSLEVATADTSGLPSLARTLAEGGITLTTLSDEGPQDEGVLHRIHELMAVAGEDIPVLGTHTPFPYDEFRKFFVEGPTVIPQAWFLAQDGPEYVGLSFGSTDSAQPGVLQQHFTGTRPEYRRRKIALALKLRMIEFAKKAGFKEITTSNDSMNLPMWTINQRLGFRKTKARIQLETVFERPAAPSNRPPV